MVQNDFPFVADRHDTGRGDWLYLLHAVGTLMYKIGITSDSVEDRRRSANNKMKPHVRVVASWRFPEARDFEPLIKRLAASYLVPDLGTEWFYFRAFLEERSGNIWAEYEDSGWAHKAVRFLWVSLWDVCGHRQPLMFHTFQGTPKVAWPVGPEHRDNESAYDQPPRSSVVHMEQYSTPGNGWPFPIYAIDPDGFHWEREEHTPDGPWIPNGALKGAVRVEKDG